MKVLVDNFAVLAVENCLLQHLPGILSSEVIMGLSDLTVEAIAAESDDVQKDRSETLIKLKSLEGGLATLKYFRRLRIDGRHAASSYLSLLPLVGLTCFSTKAG